MSLILVATISIFGIVLGKVIFKKWINHLTLYCLIMGGLIFLYELKLLPYVDIIPLAWFFIISTFLSFLFGILTIISTRNLASQNEIATEKSIIALALFADDGKTVRNAILFFTFIGFFVAFQRWWVLIEMFGSIPAVFINAGVVYRLNVNREIKDFIPILPNFVYVGVFLLGMYNAYKKKFSLLTFLPFISIVIKELTYFGRGEILFALMEFLFSFFLFRYLLNTDTSRKYAFSKKSAIIVSTILIVFLGASVSLVRVSRGSYENFVGGSSQLKQLKGNFLISPSIYLYMSCDIGVFSKYLEHDKENTKFGHNSFLVFYDFLSRVEGEKRPRFYQKGFYIPMWANTGTFMRELHEDFGIAGIFLIPYLIGLFITWLWFKFYERHNLIVFAILVYFYIIIGFSFLMMVTRLNQWYFSLGLIILSIPILEKMATRKNSLNLEKG
ncbi:MAG: hypothetical protein COW85_04515 [Ignavibacteria bacterium CG22_combo_CG10-13_8_21_14_all_37_15]|nr:MAG: hypothetical protein COW85_04515 [Ignavibacteria bacterium CG22_combo_CG10-13_8_21_14_all_37_15]PJC57615.1 MAG: hypothetical protein CO025_12430 [Ignavibacteria bacterium CG_4_9_14_0_2_um_filter_37_13]